MKLLLSLKAQENFVKKAAWKSKICNEKRWEDWIATEILNFVKTFHYGRQTCKIFATYFAIKQLYCSQDCLLCLNGDNLPCTPPRFSKILLTTNLVMAWLLFHQKCSQFVKKDLAEHCKIKKGMDFLICLKQYNTVKELTLQWNTELNVRG